MDHKSSAEQIKGNERLRLRGRVKTGFLHKLSLLIGHVIRIRFVSANDTDEIVGNFYSNLKESLVFVEEHPED